MEGAEKLINKISELEEQIKRLDEQLDGYYEALEPEVEPLAKQSEEKNKEIDEVKKKTAPTFLWVIFGALVVGAIVFNAIDIGILTGICFVAGIGVLAYALSINSKFTKEYNEIIGEINKELDEIEEEINVIYATDPRIEKTEKEIEELKKELEVNQKELKRLNDIEADKKALEKLGVNNLIVRCTYAAVRCKCFPVIDGVERDYMSGMYGLYYLDPGDHTYYLNVFVTDEIIDTEDIHFTLNGNNKYIDIEHDMRTYKYEIKTYDSFDDFTANSSPESKKRVRDEILKLAE